MSDLNRVADAVRMFEQLPDGPAKTVVTDSLIAAVIEANDFVRKLGDTEPGSPERAEAVEIHDLMAARIHRVLFNAQGQRRVF